MKKKIFYLFCSVCILLSIFLTACSLNNTDYDSNSYPNDYNPGNNYNPNDDYNYNNNYDPNNGRDYKLNADMSQYSIDMDNVAQIGIASKKALNSLSDTSGISNTSVYSYGVSGSNAGNEDNLVLIQQNKKGNIEPIKYINKNKTVIEENQLDAEIYKMCVVGNFTFVSYISKNVRLYAEKYRTYKDDYGLTYEMQQYTVYCYNAKLGYYDTITIYDRNFVVPDDFDTRYYQNNEFIKSYAINNLTGKIYSLKGLNTFDIDGEYLKFSTDSYYYYYNYYTYYNYGNYIHYNYYINNNDELVIKQVVANTDIKYNKIIKDKDGYTYVFTETFEGEDTANKTIYTKTRKIFVDENKQAYELVYGYISYRNEFKIYKLKDGIREGEISYDEDVYFTDNPYGLIGIKNSVLIYKDYAATRSSNGYNYNSYNGLFYYDSLYYYNFNSQITTYGNSCYFYAYQNIIIFYNDNSKVLSYAEVDWDTKPNFNNLQNCEMLKNCDMRNNVYTLVNNTIKYNNVAFAEISLEGTKVYTVVIDKDGLPYLNLISTKVSTQDIIILKPIN